MAVITAGELHDPVPARGGAGKPHRGHRRLGSRGDETDHLHRFDGVDDPFRELDLELDGVAVCDSALQLGADGRDDPGRLMAEDVRPVREHVIDELVAVRVDDVCPVTANDVRRHTRNRPIGADGTVDATRKHPLGALAQRPRVGVLHDARSALAR